VAFAFLVILAHAAAEGGAAFVLAEASVVVVVEDEFAGKGGSPFRRAHAADGEAVDDILVAEGHEVSRLGAEGGDHHVASDALLKAVRTPEDTGEAPGEARVGEVALEWRLEPSVTVAGHNSVNILLRVELDAPRDVSSQSRAWRTGVGMGKTRLSAARVAAQVRTVHQFSQALTRVARAVPSGAITVVNAWLMSSMVRGVRAARDVTTGSQFPTVPSRGDPAEPSCRAARQAGQSDGRTSAKISWMLRAVGMEDTVQEMGSLVNAARADSTAVR
jgi:hypothetical protein